MIANLIVIIKEQSHSRYRRNNNDLAITVTVSLIDAIRGKTVDITTLDGRRLNILVDEIIR